MSEIWKDIDYYPNYEVSNLGNVRNKKTNNVKYQFLNVKGYPSVQLYIYNVRTTKCIHRLVGEAFLINTYNKPTIDHIDRNKKNNNVNNLRWATYKEQLNNRDLM